MDADSPFLDAIQSTPLDDTPRLIYADWLEENDQPERAEFIRVQCELERLPENADDRRSWLRRRESRLIEQNTDRWKDTLPKGNGITWSDFRRGFAEDVRATNGDAFLMNASRLRASTVLLGVGVLGANADFVCSPALEGLHRLQIQSGLGPSGIRARSAFPAVGSPIRA